MKKWFGAIMGLALLVSVVALAAAEPPEPPEPEGVQAATILDCTWFEDDFEDALTTWVVAGTVTTNNWHLMDGEEEIDLFGPNAHTPEPSDINPDLVTLPGWDATKLDNDPLESLPEAHSGTHDYWFGNPDAVYMAAWWDSIGSYADYTLAFDPTDGVAPIQTMHCGYTSTTSYTGTLTSQEFSLEDACDHTQLMFWTWWEIESVNAKDHDLMVVKVFSDTTEVITETLNPPANPVGADDDLPMTSAGFNVQPEWVQVAIDLTPIKGAKKVKIQFYFDTVDESRNGFRGWKIDDVKVTSPTPIPCPCEAALEGESRESDLDILRRFRDEVLAASPVGSRYIELYYEHTREVTWLLLSDSTLRSRAREVIEELVPGIRGLLSDGTGQEIVLTEDMMEDIESLLDDLAARGSLELRATIGEVKGLLRVFEGESFKEIRSLMSTDAADPR